MEVKKSKKFVFQLIVGASALTDKQGKCVDQIKKDGFKVDYNVEMSVTDDTPSSMVHSVGIGLLKLPEIFEKIKPDLVFIVGDRYEVMSAAIAASYMNIPLAHTMGGEVTGTIDESIRHSITKLAHLHFVSNLDSYKRVLKLGEHKKNIFNVGCPRIDVVKKELNNKDNLEKLKKFIDLNGVGDKINLDEKFLLLSQHPVTTEYGNAREQINQTIKAVKQLNMQTIILWPNTDAGSDKISKSFRLLREENGLNLKKVRFFKNIPHSEYFNLLKICSCLIGNSSSPIREGAFIGVPAVNIGTRQNKRLKSYNVINVKNNFKNIKSAILKQIKKGRYKSSNIYGNGGAAVKILKILDKIKEINVQKTISY
jgi:UDP-hydrolysing UDP-N-acetyl-D-glucosamine 2-epimerase